MTKLWGLWFAAGLFSACAGKPTHTPDVREITHRALERGRREAGAASALAVVIDARNGRLLAIASSDDGANRKPTHAVVQQPVPAGLLATPILVASAIKMGRGRLDVKYDTENGRYQLRE